MTARPRTQEEVHRASPEEPVNHAELREQLRAEILAEQAAIAEAAEAAKNDPNRSRTIHFLEDGFTALGRVYYRGEELTVEPGTEEWQKTLDGRGLSWLDMSDVDQKIRYKRVMFARGPWPGETYDEADPELTEEQRATLKEVNARRFADTLTPGLSYKKG